jgi:hypothetical protein
VFVSGHVPLFFGDRQSAALRSRWTHSRRNIKPLKKKDIATGGFSAEKQAINKNRRKKKEVQTGGHALFILHQVQQHHQSVREVDPNE